MVQNAPMPHAVLLGDSIFDNGAYTDGAPDVAACLRELLPPGWRVTLAAIDGSSTIDFEPQLAEVPPEATHLVVSLGGNDGLRSLDLLFAEVGSVAEALALFEAPLAAFETDYRATLGKVLALGRETFVCTIYDTDPETPWEVSPRPLLALWNDAILRVAFGLGLPVVDLRGVCTESADYEAWIEPSGPGGRKIAAAVARALTDAGGGSRLYAG